MELKDKSGKTILDTVGKTNRIAQQDKWDRGRESQEPTPSFFTQNQIERRDMDIVYPCKNTRQCYWLCRDCLKGHAHRCSPKCPDYLSIARVKKQSK